MWLWKIGNCLCCYCPCTYRCCLSWWQRNSGKLGIGVLPIFQFLKYFVNVFYFINTNNFSMYIHNTDLWFLHLMFITKRHTIPSTQLFNIVSVLLYTTCFDPCYWVIFKWRVQNHQIIKFSCLHSMEFGPCSYVHIWICDQFV